MTLSKLKGWLKCKRRKLQNKNKKIQMAQMETESMEDHACCKTYGGMPTTFVKDYGHIPVLLTNAAAVVEKNIKTKGIFQNMGNSSKTITTQLSGRRKSNKVKNANVHDVIEAMKKFLASLPGPLLPEQECDSMIQYLIVLSEFRNSFPENFAILHFVMRLLSGVLDHSEHNCMDARKLATIFVLDVIRPMKTEDFSNRLLLTETMQRLPYLMLVVENLIQNVDIFKIIGSLERTGFHRRGASSVFPTMTSHPAGLPGAINCTFSEKRYSLSSPQMGQRQNYVCSPTSMKTQSRSVVESQDLPSQKENSPAAAVYFFEGEVKVISRSGDSESSSTESILQKEGNVLKMKDVLVKRKCGRRPKKVLNLRGKKLQTGEGKRQQCRKRAANKGKAESSLCAENKQLKTPDTKSIASTNRNTPNKIKQKSIPLKNKLQRENKTPGTAQLEKEASNSKDKSIADSKDFTEKVLRWMMESKAYREEKQGNETCKMDDDRLRDRIIKVVEEMRMEGSPSLIPDINITLTKGTSCKDGSTLGLGGRAEKPGLSSKLLCYESTPTIVPRTSGRGISSRSPSLKISVLPGNIPQSTVEHREDTTFVEIRGSPQVQNTNPQLSSPKCDGNIRGSSPKCDIDIRASSPKCDDNIRECSPKCDSDIRASSPKCDSDIRASSPKCDSDIRASSPKSPEMNEAFEKPGVSSPEIQKEEELQIATQRPESGRVPGRGSDELPTRAGDHRQILHVIVRNNRSALRVVIRQLKPDNQAASLPEF